MPKNDDDDIYSDAELMMLQKNTRLILMLAVQCLLSRFLFFSLVFMCTLCTVQF